MNKKSYGFLFFIFLSIISTAQKYTISGYVKDAATGEMLIGAGVYVKGSKTGTITNQYGFYSLTLKKETYQLQVSFLGYKNFSKEITLTKDIRLNVSLSPNAIMTKEVTISAERSDKNVRSVQMSTVRIPVKQVKEIPAIFGEVDILKTIQLLPGVQSAGEGNSGFYVRGGGPDQNLIILDDAVVYNAAHLFGFFSVFNADAIKDVRLIKGGMPAQYGGRLSSVLDITMKDGNMRKLSGEGGIGLISSRLTVEGPIKKDTSSFIISGRRTYIDLLLKPFIKEGSRMDGTGYYFYDLNTKVNYRFSDKDRLYLSGYFGRDVFSFRSPKGGNFQARIPWGNATLSTRWNHLFTNKLFMNTSVVFTDYKFSFEADQSDFEFKLFSGVTDYSAKIDFTYLPEARHKVLFGLNYTFHDFKPGTVTGRMGETEFNIGDIKSNLANDLACYISDEFDVTEDLKLIVGLRPTMFQQVGPFDRFVTDNLGNITDTVHYQNFENVITYFRAEPRASLRYAFNEKTSVKAAYTQNYQYVHLASMSSMSLPMDIWVPSSTLVKPQYSQQYTAGLFRNFKDNLIETSVELYYKKMTHIIEYKDGAMPGENIGNNEDANFVFGEGYSYGVELFIKKNIGKLTGWIGYTLSKTDHIFPDINEGNPFPAKYDRRHDLSVVLNYHFNDQLTFSTVFVYATGNTMTLPIGRYLIDNRIVVEYMPRNGYRMAPYHRMDVSLTYTPKYKEGKRVHSSWNLSVYNVYNRANPYFIYFDYTGSIQEGDLVTSAYQVSLFPILPSITWNFNF